MSLLGADELAARIPSPDLIVCDVRFSLADRAQGRQEYAAGHIPSARFVDLHTDLAGGIGGGRHPLPSPGDFAALLGRLGVTPDSTVVAYDSAGGAMAARLWWMLRSIGHRDAEVLDGGWQAWVAAGHAVETSVPLVEATTYPPAGRWTNVVDADAVAVALARGVTVIDARGPERFRGELEPIDPRAGHIPGAVNRFHGENLRADGTHRPRSELASRFADLGAAPIVYCGSGVTACADLLAMDLAGISDARLYAGSWSDWCADPDRPIATGGAEGDGEVASPHRSAP